MLRYSILVVMLISQATFSQNKLLEMKNAFLLGLREKGLELCLTLISDPQYSLYKEEATYYIAEQFFYELISSDKPKVDVINQSFTFYSIYLSEYPAGKYANTAINRRDYLERKYNNSLTFGRLNDAYQNERRIVEKYFDYYNAFAEIKSPAWYEFYFHKPKTQSMDVLNDYYENIAKNFPNFAVFAYYRVFLITIDPFIDGGVVIPKMLKVNRQTIIGYGSYDTVRARILYKADSILAKMVSIAPHHYLTLDAHLIMAKTVMKAITSFNKMPFHREPVEYVNYVLLNDNDILSPRYILAKEYILNNKYEELDPWRK